MAIPELELYRQQFESLADQAQDMIAGLTEAQFNWRPEPVSWSIEECLAHLVMTGNVYIANLESAISDARTRGMRGQPPFQYGMIDEYIVGMVERQKFTAPRRFQPLHGQPVTGILPSFLHVQRQFADLVQKADGLDLARVKVDTSISRFIRLSLGMTFALISAHERRHLEQARRVREQI